MDACSIGQLCWRGLSGMRDEWLAHDCHAGPLSLPRIGLSVSLCGTRLSPSGLRKLPSRSHVSATTATTFGYSWKPCAAP